MYLTYSDGVTGITPADAGKTSDSCSGNSVAGDHPRGCGENRQNRIPGGENRGSPPRMRGKLIPQFPSVLSSGITPADAGKTRRVRVRVRVHRDHPRGCGENLMVRLYQIR